MKNRTAQHYTDARVWLAQRTPRERVLLFVLVLAGLAYLAYSLVLAPLHETRKSALADIERYGTIIARLQAAGPVTASPDPVAVLPPSQAITTSAAEAGLDIRRLEPEGAETIVMLDQVSFDTMLIWVDILEQDHGLILASADISRRPEPGTVNARLSFERRGG